MSGLLVMVLGFLLLLLAALTSWYNAFPVVIGFIIGGAIAALVAMIVEVIRSN